MKRISLVMTFIAALLSSTQFAMAGIRPGAVWPDNRGIHINAHGGGVLRCGDTFYWFGEHKADTTSSQWSV